MRKHIMHETSILPRNMKNKINTFVVKDGRITALDLILKQKKNKL